MAKELTEKQKIDVLKRAVDELDMYREGAVKDVELVMRCLVGDNPMKYVQAGLTLQRMLRDLIYAEEVMNALPSGWEAWGSGPDMYCCDCDCTDCRIARGELNIENDPCDCSDDDDEEDFSGKRMYSELRELIRECVDEALYGEDDMDDI